MSLFREEPIVRPPDLAPEDDGPDDEVCFPFSGFASVWTIPNAESLKWESGEFMSGLERDTSLCGLLRRVAQSPLPVFSGFTSSILLGKIKELGVDTFTASNCPLGLWLRKKESYALAFDHTLASASAEILKSVPDSRLLLDDTERAFLGGVTNCKGHITRLADWLEGVTEGSHGLWYVEHLRCITVDSFVAEHATTPLR